MRFTSLSAFATLLLRCTFAVPYPLSNATDTTNTTFGTPSSGPYVCQRVYPSDLTIVNSRYPDYGVGHLHNTTLFFMLRRQILGEGEIATRVQFQGLPSAASNKTCRLEFVLPNEKLQKMQGTNPSFDIYQVQGDADAIATWNTYKGSEGVSLFGRINGESEALEKTRGVGGIAAVNETVCAETLTFQMGMAYDGGNLPNYWDFPNVAPPAWPIQGFRIVYGC
ncbi:uncharacterized protein EKO05_0011369 [Ascochyta rabiei]|uniref:Uncharacterized protein n=1 Tax=Didymella rabiei TaxID=5454 RepID=A0A163C8B2_DIDRA|nr:uncharacterized protein EKO05_0011369 [Ascochyta rabiei]KZM22275.1 hypothetical protein ST47_g6580 [Ascochyta rabiei]UPX21173.1 hypothetical protein EKO05_0011369 [Ascochyta rabiei]